MTDIEGTTSSLSFVKDMLFPYAKKQLPMFVKERQADPKVKEILKAVNLLVDKQLSIQAAIETLTDWIDQDLKHTPLKSLQGLIWDDGYKQGDFTGHVYQDAYQQLKQWHNQGIRLYVYSSGSVFAQKLLFGYSDFGDMTHLFSGYFDTRMGHKKDIGSYRSIIENIALPQQSILFLSDAVDELDAAKQAGMHVCWIDRDQSADIQSKYRSVPDFTSINFE